MEISDAVCVFFMEGNYGHRLSCCFVVEVALRAGIAQSVVCWARCLAEEEGEVEVALRSLHLAWTDFRRCLFAPL